MILNSFEFIRKYFEEINLFGVSLGLQAEAASQKRDAAMLTNQVTTLEDQLQQLMIGLDQLDPSTASCRNN